MKFDFSLSFELNVAEIVSSYNKKDMITKGSDNYLVLKALYNQHYVDNEEGRVQRLDGSLIKHTSQRVWDLTHKFGVVGISSRWVTGVRSDYKQYWISRRENAVTVAENE